MGPADNTLLYADTTSQDSTTATCYEVPVTRQFIVGQNALALTITNDPGANRSHFLYSLGHCQLKSDWQDWRGTRAW